MGGGGNAPVRQDAPLRNDPKLEDDTLAVKPSELPAETTGVVVLDLVQEKWREFVAQVSRINSSVGALIKSARPLSVDGNAIVLEVSYKFHKERLESSANLKIVEKALREVFDCRSTIKCFVCQKEASDLTDLNIKIPQNVVIDSKLGVVEVFDGGLPL